MRIIQLELRNFRALESARFVFRPGINLVAGVNGVGKTSLMDALSVCLSRIVNEENKLRRKKREFGNKDVRFGNDSLHVHCKIAMNDGRLISQIFDVEPRSVTAKEKSIFSPFPPRVSYNRHVTKPELAYSDPFGKALAISFSTHRSLSPIHEPNAQMAAGGIRAASAYALTNRGLRLREFCAWMRAQEELAPEWPPARHMLTAFEKAITRFLPSYRNLRVDRANGDSLLIDQGDMTMPVRMLSDGERGLLAMVLDLTRRLAQANPETKDPAAEAGAVVLIDEIELHLHPGWQRRVVKNLVETFPKCQFIATTHSPQVIGEVDHDRIHIVANNQVYSPRSSFGMDSNRVLEEIMYTDPRNKKVKELLSKISRKIGNDQYEDARSLLPVLVRYLGEDDPEVTRILTLLDFMTDDA